MTASGLIDGTHYVISRHMSLSPAVVAGYNQDEEAITYQEEVEIEGDVSNGTWGAIASGDDLYIGMSFDDDERRSAILKLDHDTGELNEAASTYPARLIWDMDTAPDGTIYAVTSRQNGAGLWEYDPETDEARHRQRLEEESRQDARSVAASAGAVYIGLGNAEPDLIAYDRDSGEEESLLPEELEDSDYVYALDATEELLAVGTSASAYIAVMDPDDSEDYSVAEVPSGTVQEIEIVEDAAYFTSGGRLFRYEKDEDEPEEVAEVDPEGGQTRGLYYQNGVLHGTGSLGYLWTYDVDDDYYIRTSLLDADNDEADKDEAGLARGEPAQSLAASNDAVFTAGHFSLGVRETDSGDLEQVSVPGEAKASVLVEEDVYMAMYSSGELVRYNTNTEEVSALASAPSGHNRPRDLHYDQTTNHLLMAVQNDTDGGGSLVLHHLDSEETTTLEPFASYASSAVTSSNGIAYVAGSAGMQDDRGQAVVAAVDLDTEEVLWRTEPTSGAESITALAMARETIYGMSSRGDLFSLDPETQEATVTEAEYGPGQLISHQGGIYGATEDMLFALDLEEIEGEPILEDLNAEWFTWPGLTSDGCDLYTMEGTDVIHISAGPSPQHPTSSPNNEE